MKKGERKRPGEAGLLTSAMLRGSVPPPSSLGGNTRMEACFRFSGSFVLGGAQPQDVLPLKDILSY